MRTIEQSAVEKAPTELTPAELAAIDKVERWTPETQGVTLEKARERARQRTEAWMKIVPKQAA